LHFTFDFRIFLYAKAMKKGFVYLVGAGPGRADLITIRGAEVLNKADCVIYDKLANPVLLKFARPDAEIIHVPKRIAEGSTTQDQINQLLLDKASSGRVVVRLKGGDPCMFGRIAEEITVLAEAGIDFEIVPGITAGLAISSYAGVMLTDREYSSQVIFVTGREAEGKEQSKIDWHLIAQFEGTIVFYMGMGNLDLIAGKLIENGMAANTPAAVVCNVSLPTQRIARASLDCIGSLCAVQGIEAPAIIVVGSASESDTSFDWFKKKPLFGKNIVITRDAAGNADFADKIITRGANPIRFETIEIKPDSSITQNLKLKTKNLQKYDWIIFTSVNGVAIFFDAIHKLGMDARLFGKSKIAAIGERTASRLAEFGIKADFVPEVFTGRELALQLAQFTDLKGKKILLLRSELASNELVEGLEKAGAEVENIAIYTAVPVKSDSQQLAEKIKTGQIDWITFASPSAVEAFFEQIDVELIRVSNIKIASIGPVTSKALERIDVPVTLTSKEHTLDGLLDSMEKYYNKKDRITNIE
jgi:uroporphyrinogen III methyltransferase / synthase